ncbi:MAG: site-specific integrase [Bacillota bacterium]|nr:site-specific integrase [Bacillota bacterium]
MIRRHGRRWQVRVYAGQAADGRQRYLYGSAATRQEAEALEERLRARAEGGPADAGRLTLADLLDRWLEHVRTHREPETARFYETYTARARERLGPVRLDRLRPILLQAYFDELRRAPRRDGRRGPLSGAALQSHYRALRACLGYAVRMGILDANPMSRVTVPRAQAAPKPVVGYRELRRLLEAARGTPWHPLFHVAAYTGLRVGELAALRWADVDWRRPALVVRHSLKEDHRTGERYLGDVKSHEARAVVLDEETARLLRRMRGTDEAFVFGDAVGRPMRPTSATRALRRLSASLGLPPLNMHRLRHIHGSLLLAGELPPLTPAGRPWDLAAVSRRLGHASVAITAEVYVHEIPDAQDRYIYPGRGLPEPAQSHGAEDLGGSRA